MPRAAVGRVLGIPVFLNASMLLLALLVTLVYGNYVSDELGLSTPVGYLIGFGFVNNNGDLYFGRRDQLDVDSAAAQAIKQFRCHT